MKKEQVFVGVGSDEAIDMLIRMVCEPRQDRILILPPTYGRPPCDKGRIECIAQAKRRGDVVGWFGLTLLVGICDVLVAPGMYQVSATVNDIHTDSVMLSRDFQFSAAEVLAAIKPHTKIIFICSPNNPTARYWPAALLERLSVSPLLPLSVDVHSVLLVVSGK